MFAIMYGQHSRSSTIQHRVLAGLGVHRLEHRGGGQGVARVAALIPRVVGIAYAAL